MRLTQLFTGRIRWDAGMQDLGGTADPEGSVIASPGSTYRRTNGSNYIKASGTGNTGWVAVSTGSVSTNVKTAGIAFIIDGAGSAIAAGVKGFLQVPFNCTIISATVLSIDAAATAGSIVIDIWKDVYANYPPTVADTITASAKPTLSSASKSTDSTLTGWTPSIVAGDVLGYKVDSATTVTRVLIQLGVVKT